MAFPFSLIESRNLGVDFVTPPGKNLDGNGRPARCEGELLRIAVRLISTNSSIRIRFL
jgi:hypothetical protein